MSEQVQNISSLQKQIHAYEGFNDEETRATVQKLKVELESAQQDLQETEYDKYISDQSALLDSLYEEYELILNQRLDNVDALIGDVITEVNTGATTISNTLTNAAAGVGTTLSESMQNIWSQEGAATKVVGTYGDKLTTINTVLDGIKTAVNEMAGISDKEATENINSNDTQPSSKADPTNNNNNKNNSNNNKATDRSEKDYYGVALAIWNGNYGWGNGDTRTKRLKEKGFNVSKVQGIVNRIGRQGYVHTAAWIEKYYGITDKDLKKYSLNSYAIGKKNFLDNEIAWTQENGQEFIIRPSDGAILTPIAKGDSVLTSAASSNIWDMANSPAEFIKDNLNLGVANVPNGSSVNNTYSQHIDNVVFRMDNVKNYEEMLAAMKSDKNFDRLIKAMTIDQIAGRSSLAKNKSIR